MSGDHDRLYDIETLEFIYTSTKCDKKVSVSFRQDGALDQVMDEVFDFLKAIGFSDETLSDYLSMYATAKEDFECDQYDQKEQEFWDAACDRDYWEEDDLTHGGYASYPDNDEEDIPDGCSSTAWEDQLPEEKDPE